MKKILITYKNKWYIRKLYNIFMKYVYQMWSVFSIAVCNLVFVHEELQFGL